MSNKVIVIGIAGGSGAGKVRVGSEAYFDNSIY